MSLEPLGAGRGQLPPLSTEPETRDSGDPGNVVSILRAELKHCADRIAALQATATTIIQLSILALAAGIAAYSSLPVSLALVPPLTSVWFFYLFALDRETNKLVAHREWLEDQLNFRVKVLLSPEGVEPQEYFYPYQWQRIVEVRTSYSHPTMLYGLYALVGIVFIVGWFVAANVLLYELARGDDAYKFAYSYRSWIVVFYCIIGIMILVSLITGVVETANLRSGIARDLYSDNPVPGSAKRAIGDSATGEWLPPRPSPIDWALSLLPGRRSALGSPQPPEPTSAQDPTEDPTEDPAHDSARDQL